MSAVNSTMLPLGTLAPAFELKGVVSGSTISLDTFKDKKALVVIFMCRHCPYVKHVQNEIADIGRDYEEKNVGIVAISANPPDEYPEDAPESLAEQAQELGFTFPYCYDETQEVARAYSAACTPDFFLFDVERKLVYRGQLDGARPGNEVAANGHDLRMAIDAILEDREVSVDQKPSLGCSIKWRTNSGGSVKT